jgi:predicted permease
MGGPFLLLRHAFRGWRSRPLFAAVTILSIAIGIGANTTMFSLAHAVLFRPPAGLTDPDRAVEVTRTVGGRGRDTFSYPEFLDLRSMAADAFEHLAGWRGATFSYVDAGAGERLSGMVASHNYFAAMGVEPLVGRFFLEEEDRTPLTHPVAVVSEAFWRDRLGATAEVLGRTLVLNRRTFTIVGVVPAPFRGHVFGFKTDVWVPMMMMGVAQPGFDAFKARESSWFTLVGRLRPGVTLDQAQAMAHTAFRGMPQRSADPANQRSAAVEPLGLLPAPGRAPVTAFFAVLGALVGIILLVTCANVAGMLLARATAREREIAVRLALGSGRARLVRQLVLEAGLLFAAGGGAGVLLALWSTRLLAAVPLPAPVPFALDFPTDVRVLALGLGLALVTGVIFGLVPSLHATRPDLTAMMKASGFRAGRGGRLRSLFVMGQVGLSLLLLLAAGLFLRSLQRATAVPVGFDASGVTVAGLDLSMDGYDEPRGQRFVADVVTRLATAPGMTAAAASNDLPLDLSRNGASAFVTSPLANAEGWVESEFNIVTPGYFDALRIRFLEGRPFDRRDMEGAEAVAIVSRTFAEQTWPGESSLGKVVRFASVDGEPRTVVGVVEDVKNSTLMEPPMRMVYLPLGQEYTPSLTLIARGAPGTNPALALHTALREADPALSRTPVQSLSAITALGLLPQRFAAGVTTVLGGIALLLSGMGVYGVVALMVAQRTREIGVRVALGARARQVAWFVLRGGLRVAAPGVAVGLAAGLGLSRILRSFLLGLAPSDPVTFLAGPVILLLTVAIACWVPARKAAALEPTEALRSEQ